MSETLGYDDKRIPDGEYVVKQSHITLHDTFEAMDPTEANAAKDEYAAIARDWESTVTVFAARIRRSSESAWDGPASNAARQAISDYATDALNLTPALNALSARVGDMVNAVTETKKNMPAFTDDPQSPWNPGDWWDGDKDGDAERAAQTHVQTNYTGKALQADLRIPTLPQPRDPVAVDDVPQGEWKRGGGDGGGNGGGNGGGGTGGGGTGGGGNGGEGTGEEVTPGTEEQTENETTDDSTTDDTTSPASTDPAATTPASTLPSSTSPTTSAASTSGLPGSGGGFPGSGGGSGGSSGSTGLPGAGVPGAGRSLAGSPLANGMPAAAGMAGAGSAAGSGTGRGMPMMGAPGAAGRGGGGDNESDRKTPDYLINEENARELLGDEPRTIPGGVLGADIPAARPAEGPPRT
ncbi:hypothetical protein [Nocardia cyriacigeorgica]|uniref:hypothetical protein n=1 Tax=Nocardia cyriacigeorgica TaxID=135487 RepID=UPI001485EBB7|nr:hypothetical protein [Nocardia cyriacigeorgica]